MAVLRHTAHNPQPAVRMPLMDTRKGTQQIGIVLGPRHATHRNPHKPISGGKLLPQLCPLLGLHRQPRKINRVGNPLQLRGSAHLQHPLPHCLAHRRRSVHPAPRQPIEQHAQPSAFAHVMKGMHHARRGFRQP